MQSKNRLDGERMEAIKFNDANDIVTKVVLDNVQYRIRLTWNAVGEFWTLHLWDNDKKTLCCNLKIVPNFPLLMNHHRPGIPSGELIVLTDLEKITRSSFTNGAASLIYVTEAEFYGKTV